MQQKINAIFTKRVIELNDILSLCNRVNRSFHNMLCLIKTAICTVGTTHEYIFIRSKMPNYLFISENGVVTKEEFDVMAPRLIVRCVPQGL